MLQEARAKKLLSEVESTGRLVENKLLRCVSKPVRLTRTLKSVVRYALPDIGFRIRPFLIRAAYEGLGRQFSDVLTVCAGIELLQASTLVIDDVFDESPMRNAKPSIFGKWGAKRAFAAGTFMSAEALALVAQALAQSKQLQNHFRVVVLLQRTHSAIYAGQFADVDYAGRTSVSESDYTSMISATTGEFIKASLVIGGVLRGASPRVISILKKAGRDLGLAYQLRDDVIDLIGDPKCTGKPLAGDVRERKMRLPVIHALEKLRGRNRGRLASLYRSGRSLTNAEVREVLDLLDGVGAVGYAISRTKELCSNAARAARQLPGSERLLANRLLAVADLISNFEGEKG